MNAPESAQIGRSNLKATRRDVDALSKVRQNWYVYFRDGAFTFARNTENDDLKEVKARICDLLAKYVKKDVNALTDLFFVYGNVEGRQ